MITLDFNIKSYSELFVFENNLKIYLDLKMESVFGDNWLQDRYLKIFDKCDYMKSQKIKYLSNCNQNLSVVFFLYFSHIRQIFEADWIPVFYDDFSEVNKDKHKCKAIVTDKLLEIEIIRNALSHAQIISADNYKQMSANINFFKSYIPTYDERLYGGCNQTEEILLYNDQLRIIKDMILNERPITRRMLHFITDETLKNQLNEISEMPRTMGVRISSKYCDLKSTILSKLSQILGD